MSIIEDIGGIPLKFIEGLDKKGYLIYVALGLVGIIIYLILKFKGVIK